MDLCKKYFPNPFIFRVFLFCCLCTSTLATPQSKNSKYLQITVDEFEKSITSAVNYVQSIIPIMHTSSLKHNDSQLSNATTNCLELLDSTLELLEWSLSIVQNPKVEDYGTGDVSSDLKTWLSAALSNQATCMEELEDIHHKIANKEMVATMDKVTTILRGLLSSVLNIPSTSSSTKWVKPTDIHNFKPNVIVAADGSGSYTKIMDAVAKAPQRSNNRHVIYIKKGLYNEYVQIKKEYWNIVMVGDGIGQTIIAGDHSYSSGYSTMQSATVGVDGQKFIAIGITFENRAGEQGQQAVALRSSADQSIFYLCEMKGYQDTLYPQRNRQFYRECRISGTIDFIFGDGTVVFQKCEILARQRHQGKENTITAQKREEPNGVSGYSFHLCTITGDSDLMGSKIRTKTYLGRPWGKYSQVVFMESSMSDIIEPDGWLKWTSGYESTVFYAEYSNNGPGSNVSNRVKWAGVHVIDKNTASKFSVSEFIQGNTFIPLANIPYIGGLQQ